MAMEAALGFTLVTSAAAGGGVGLSVGACCARQTTISATTSVRFTLHEATSGQEAVGMSLRSCMAGKKKAGADDERQHQQ